MPLEAPIRAGMRPVNGEFFMKSDVPSMQTPSGSRRRKIATFCKTWLVSVRAATLRLKARPCSAIGGTFRRSAFALAFSLAAEAAVPSGAAGISQFNRLHRALDRGDPIFVIAQLGLCKEAPGARSIPREIVGGFRLQSFMITGGNAIRFSDQHLTIGPDGLAKIELVNYIATSDERVRVDVHRLNPSDYAPQGSAQSYTCTLGEGVRFTYPSSH
jgi:hypothetical protein